MSDDDEWNPDEDPYNFAGNVKLVNQLVKFKRFNTMIESQNNIATFDELEKTKLDDHKPAPEAEDMLREECLRFRKIFAELHDRFMRYDMIGGCAYTSVQHASLMKKDDEQMECMRYAAMKAVSDNSAAAVVAGVCNCKMELGERLLLLKYYNDLIEKQNMKHRELINDDELELDQKKSSWKPPPGAVMVGRPPQDMGIIRELGAEYMRFPKIYFGFRARLQHYGYLGRCALTSLNMPSNLLDQYLYCSMNMAHAYTIVLPPLC